MAVVFEKAPAIYTSVLTNEQICAETTAGEILTVQGLVDTMTKQGRISGGLTAVGVDDKDRIALFAYNPPCYHCGEKFSFWIRPHTRSGFSGFYMLFYMKGISFFVSSVSDLLKVGRSLSAVMEVPRRLLFHEEIEESEDLETMSEMKTQWRLEHSLMMKPEAGFEQVTVKDVFLVAVNKEGENVMQR